MPWVSYTATQICSSFELQTKNIVRQTDGSLPAWQMPTYLHIACSVAKMIKSYPKLIIFIWINMPFSVPQNKPRWHLVQKYIVGFSWKMLIWQTLVSLIIPFCLVDVIYITMSTWHSRWAVSSAMGARAEYFDICLGLEVTLSIQKLGMLLVLLLWPARALPHCPT